jgi:hypothetical protein
MKNWTFVFILTIFGIIVTFTACDDNNDPLNGNWALDETVLKFNNGDFEWTAYGNLQQRGYYDTKDGVLTITIKNNYGRPQYYLGNYSRPYSINGNILTWGSYRYTKK